MELSELNVINPIMLNCAAFTLDMALFLQWRKKKIVLSRHEHLLTLFQLNSLPITPYLCQSLSLRSIQYLSFYAFKMSY